MIEPLRVSVEVACGAEHAFDTWTDRFGMYPHFVNACIAQQEERTS